MSGCKGFGNRAHKRRYGKSLETGKPFPPPGGFYVMWPITPTRDGYERWSSAKN